MFLLTDYTEALKGKDTKWAPAADARLDAIMRPPPGSMHEKQRADGGGWLAGSAQLCGSRGELYEQAQ